MVQPARFRASGHASPAPARRDRLDEKRQRLSGHRSEKKQNGEQFPVLYPPRPASSAGDRRSRGIYHFILRKTAQFRQRRLRADVPLWTIPSADALSRHTGGNRSSRRDRGHQQEIAPGADQRVPFTFGDHQKVYQHFPDLSRASVRKLAAGSRTNPERQPGKEFHFSRRKEIYELEVGKGICR